MNKNVEQIGLTNFRFFKPTSKPISGSTTWLKIVTVWRRSWLVLFSRTHNRWQIQDRGSRDGGQEGPRQPWIHRCVPSPPPPLDPPLRPFPPPGFTIQRPQHLTLTPPYHLETFPTLLRVDHLVQLGRVINHLQKRIQWCFGSGICDSLPDPYSVCGPGLFKNCIKKN